MTFYYNERVPRGALHAYIVQILWDIYSYYKELNILEDEEREALAIMSDHEIEESDSDNEDGNGNGGGGDAPDDDDAGNEQAAPKETKRKAPKQTTPEETEWNFAHFIESNEDTKFFLDVIRDEIKLHEPDEIV